MKDGAIIGNKASTSGGGVLLAENSIFNMHGGSITGNTLNSATGAGGVSVGSNHTEGGVSVTIPGGTFNMFKPAEPGPNGSITGNSGGAGSTQNFYISEDAIFTVDGVDQTTAYASGW
jgi:hypothetical protein